ncbi:RsmB/NOP family class I SAM-dependent RNA methyltransferase [Pelistega ratti]|uniref:RsmB/NOP family class I SAM-dependent RNA methyltransferase n=1 Tax=Pelistega ratti TaxID=2652177 RepID=UPI0019167294|nr:RsmB/NOP family class I SAM-dependent RNA methyltransferase [Pelistega ratti]
MMKKNTTKHTKKQTIKRHANTTSSFAKLPILQQRIQQVAQVLDKVLKFNHPADAVLSAWFKENRQLGGRDRGEVAEAVFDILRHLRFYRHLAESGVGPAHQRLAILGLVHTVGQEKVQEVLDVAQQDWLMRVLKIDQGTVAAAVRFSLPDWLFETLQQQENPEALMQALNTKAPLDLRVNPLKVERDAILATLQADDALRLFNVQATPYSPWGIRLEGKPAINRWAFFEKGEIEVQDEGSQLLCLLVSPRRTDMVIDFCAGAGGKTLLLGAMMRSQGRLYAFDVSGARLAKAKPRIARSGLSNVMCVQIENENDVRVKRLQGKAHRVLVDAPCSGVGTLRRNPDLKWRQTPQDLAELTALQARILEKASRCVASGGRLIYSTCSLLPQENEQQVEAFLANHPAFTLVPFEQVLGDRLPKGLQSVNGMLKLRPDVHGTDGFFAAVLEKA